MKGRAFRNYLIFASSVLWLGTISGFGQEGVYAPTAEPERRSAELHAYGIDSAKCWIQDDKKRCIDASVNTSKVGNGAIYAPERHVPTDAMREYVKGLEALKKNNTKLAQQHLQRATELYPKFSSAFNALGLAFVLDPDAQNKNVATNAVAERAFRQALSLNPNNTDALANLGHLLMRQDNPVEAERLLRTAVGITPDAIRIVAELMLAQAMQQHYDDVLFTAKRIAPGQELNVPIVYFLRALAWDSKSDRAQAISGYREFLKVAPNAREALLAQAALQRLEAKPDDLQSSEKK